MGRILRPNRATEDLVEIFTDVARRSPAAVPPSRRRSPFWATTPASDRAACPVIRRLGCFRSSRSWCSTGLSLPAMGSTFCACVRRRPTGWTRSSSARTDARRTVRRSHLPVWGARCLICNEVLAMLPVSARLLKGCRVKVKANFCSRCHVYSRD